MLKKDIVWSEDTGSGTQNPGPRSGTGKRRPRIEDSGSGILDPKLQDSQPKMEKLGLLDRFRLINTYFDLLFRRENGSDRE